MAGPAAVGVVSTLSTALQSLTPQQLGLLGRHLTASQEMQALQIISTMKSNPAIAGTLVPSLFAIPNLPSQVTTWVEAALTEPASFQQNMDQAETALQAAAVAPGILGSLGL
jgi:hypothetical protein